MPGKPKTPLQMTYLRFRSRGFHTAEAKAKAKEFLGRYERLKGIKKLGLTSKSAFEVVKIREILRNIQRIASQINPSYKISLREAVTVNGIYLSMTSWMGLRIKGLKSGTKKFFQTIDSIRRDFPLSDFVESYARIRFEEHRKRPTSDNEGGGDCSGNRTLA